MNPKNKEQKANATMEFLKETLQKAIERITQLEEEISSREYERESSRDSSKGLYRIPSGKTRENQFRHPSNEQFEVSSLDFGDTLEEIINQMSRLGFSYRPLLSLLPSGPYFVVAEFVFCAMPTQREEEEEEEEGEGIPEEEFKEILNQITESCRDEDPPQRVRMYGDVDEFEELRKKKKEDQQRIEEKVIECLETSKKEAHKIHDFRNSRKVYYKSIKVNAPESTKEKRVVNTFSFENIDSSKEEDHNSPGKMISHETSCVRIHIEPTKVTVYNSVEGIVFRNIKDVYTNLKKIPNPSNFDPQTSTINFWGYIDNS